MKIITGLVFVSILLLVGYPAFLSFSGGSPSLLLPLIIICAVISIFNLVINWKSYRTKQLSRVDSFGFTFSVVVCLLSVLLLSIEYTLH